MAKPHTRNVAGYKMKKLTNAVYQQDLTRGKRRWFIRFITRNKKGFHWRYTPPFEAGEAPQDTSLKSFPTLTDAVITANE